MWNRQYFQELFDPPVIGMIHLLPLPGSPCYTGNMTAVIKQAQGDAEALVAGGIRAVMVENFNDIPFFPGRVPAATVAAMTEVVSAIIARHPGLQVGVNVLRNDAEAALAVCAAVGAGFIRINVHTGAAVTDQGLIQGRAAKTMRLRRELGLEVGVLADVQVKHARPLVDRPLAAEAQDLRLRGLADGIIISGEATGGRAKPEDVEVVRTALEDCPVLIGSGMSAGTVAGFWPAADGFIVGSSLKNPGQDGGPVAVSPAKTQAFLAALNSARRQGV